jgi:hypothetical protein
VKIVIETIEHSNQRIGDVGDWWFDENGDLQIRVSKLGDWRYEFLLARHEMDEAMLCKFHGITTEQVDQGDLTMVSKNPDPDSFSGYLGAPYQYQHNDALAAEWQMSRLLDVDWIEYGKAFDPYWKEKYDPQ